MKKFKWIGYIILLVVLLVLSLTIYTNATKNGEDDQKEKTFSEIKYLDAELVRLFNRMNNIETRNYKIFTEKTEESTDKAKESNSTNQNEGESSSKNKSAGEGSSGGSNGGNSSEKTEENLQSLDSGKNTIMQEKGILTTTRDIDWQTVSHEVELIYTSIPTITLDLYQLNLSQDDILNFNKEFDNLTVVVKEENKERVLEVLSKIYDYIPRFAENVTDDIIYKTVLKTKNSIFKAYSKLDSKDWDAINANVKEAIDTYSGLLSNTSIDSNRQSSVNKAYIMLNELQNVSNVKDESVFLIKYKNLLEELDNM